MNTGLQNQAGTCVHGFRACPVGASRNDTSRYHEWVSTIVPLKSLSARLLILTAFFVMVSEVLIFVPSVARFRMTYFENRLAAGHIATLALEASATGELEQGLTDKLLAQVGARGVAFFRRDGTVLRLDSDNPPQPDA